jgi:hypothetical protein
MLYHVDCKSNNDKVHDGIDRLACSKKSGRIQAVPFELRIPEPSRRCALNPMEHVCDNGPDDLHGACDIYGSHKDDVHKKEAVQERKNAQFSEQLLQAELSCHNVAGLFGGCESETGSCIYLCEGDLNLPWSFSRSLST